MKSSRVFISHSSHDKDFAKLVVARLRSPGMAPWIDSDQIVTGDDILDQLGHGLQSMDVLVFLASKASLESEWVARELKYAVTREIEEKRVLVLPFIIDDSPCSTLPWFLRHRNVSRVTPNTTGAASVVASTQQALERRSVATAGGSSQEGKFQFDPRIDELIRNVKVGDWNAADIAAIELLKSTNEFGWNELFEALLKYQECPNDDLLWGALMTIESCAQLAPWLIDRELLARMASHRNFSVRSSAASICMDFAQFAPELTPIDILLKLSVYDEDWYVQAPATAALQAMARLRPAILRIFLERLLSPNPDARAHAARALAGIAEKEPEILDWSELKDCFSKLKEMGDREAIDYIAEAIPKVRQAEKASRFKYGI